MEQVFGIKCHYIIFLLGIWDGPIPYSKYSTIIYKYLALVSMYSTHDIYSNVYILYFIYTYK